MKYLHLPQYVNADAICESGDLLSSHTSVKSAHEARRWNARRLLSAVRRGLKRAGRVVVETNGRVEVRLPGGIGVPIGAGKSVELKGAGTLYVGPEFEPYDATFFGLLPGSHLRVGCDIDGPEAGRYYVSYDVATTAGGSVMRRVAGRRTGDKSFESVMTGWQAVLNYDEDGAVHGGEQDGLDLAVAEVLGGGRLRLSESARRDAAKAYLGLRPVPGTKAERASLLAHGAPWRTPRRVRLFTVAGRRGKEDRFALAQIFGAKVTGNFSTIGRASHPARTAANVEIAEADLTGRTGTVNSNGTVNGERPYFHVDNAIVHDCAYYPMGETQHLKFQTLGHGHYIHPNVALRITGSVYRDNLGTPFKYFSSSEIHEEAEYAVCRNTRFENNGEEVSSSLGTLRLPGCRNIDTGYRTSASQRITAGTAPDAKIIGQGVEFYPYGSSDRKALKTFYVQGLPITITERYLLAETSAAFPNARILFEQCAITIRHATTDRPLVWHEPGAQATVEFRGGHIDVEQAAYFCVLREGLTLRLVGTQVTGTPARGFWFAERGGTVQLQNGASLDLSSARLYQ